MASLRSYSVGGHSSLTMSSALADAQYKLDYIMSTMAYLEPRATHTYNNFHDDLLKLLDFGDAKRLGDVKRRFLRLQEGLRDLNDTLTSSAGNASHVSSLSNCF